MNTLDVIKAGREFEQCDCPVGINGFHVRTKYCPPSDYTTHLKAVLTALIEEEKLFFINEQNKNLPKERARACFNQAKQETIDRLKVIRDSI